LLAGVQQVPPVRGDRVAAQLGEAGAAPDVRGDAVLGGEQLGGRLHLAQDGAAAEQLNAGAPGPALGAAQQVHAPLDALDDLVAPVFRHAGMLVVLVHHGEVVEDVLLIGEHPPQTVLEDHRDLVT
jgi:hypothetical protein